MLLIHIAIAFISLIFTTWLFIAPSQSKLKASYSLVAATLATGTYLVVSTKTHILQTCLTGLVYVGVVSICLVLARQKLAKERAKN